MSEDFHRWKGLVIGNPEKDGKETEYLVLYNNIVVGRYSNIADANFNCSELANCKNKSEIKAFFKNWHQDIVNLVFFPKSSDNWKINLEKYQLLNIPMAATQAELDELQECRLNECKDEEQRKLLQEKWAEYQEELGNKQQFDKQKNCIDVDKFTVRPISNGEWSANVSHLKHDVYLKSMPERDQLKKKNKNRHITFLIFHSGNVIMSSPITGKYTKQIYEEFASLMSKNFTEFMEKLDEPF